MTYAIHITVSGGSAQVTSQSEGEEIPPDGIYTIEGSVGRALEAGHTAESIGVSRNELPVADSASGVGVLRASATAYVSS